MVNQRYCKEVDIVCHVAGKDIYEQKRFLDDIPHTFLYGYFLCDPIRQTYMFFFVIYIVINTFNQGIHFMDIKNMSDFINFDDAISLWEFDEFIICGKIYNKYY